MSKKAGRFRTGSEVARHSPVARRQAATSRPWPDLLSNHPWAESTVSVLHRSNRRRIAAAFPSQGARSPSRGVSFGAWHLPPLSEVFSSSRPLLEQAAVCARRRIRRELLFAVRGTGAGSKGRRLHFSNRSCK